MKRQKRSITILMTLMALLGLSAIIHAGQLQPTAPPAPTMKTLDEIYQKLSVMETKINLIQLRLATGSRFIDNGNGTVIDTSTGLIWLKTANPSGQINWTNAVVYCSSLASGAAGLTDGSKAGDWRLPSKEELEGIGTNPPTTWNEGNPSVLWTMPGEPFTGVIHNFYWTSTAYASNPEFAYGVGMTAGLVTGFPRNNGLLVWPVRGPQ